MLLGETNPQPYGFALKLAQDEGEQQHQGLHPNVPAPPAQPGGLAAHPRPGTWAASSRKTWPCEETERERTEITGHRVLS